MSGTGSRIAFIEKQLHNYLSEVEAQEQRISSYLSELSSLVPLSNEQQLATLLPTVRRLKRCAVAKATRLAAGSLLLSLKQLTDAAGCDDAAPGDAASASDDRDPNLKHRKRKCPDQQQLAPAAEAQLLEGGGDGEEEEKRLRRKRKKHSVERKEHRGHEQEKSVRGQEHSVQKQVPSVQKQEHSVQKQVHSVQKRDPNVQKQEHSVQKQEESTKRQERKAVKGQSCSSQEHEHSEEKRKQSSTAQKQEVPAAASDSSMTTEVELRRRCREMLEAALQQSSSSSSSSSITAPELSASIEQCIYDLFGTADGKYRNRVRSRVQNLRNAGNPQLRQLLLEGSLSARDFASLPHEQLASAEMRKLRERLSKEAIEKIKIAATVPAGPSLFTCKRCRRNSCTYSQLQTLAGDEPMTTYVFCNDCGFRWKFN